jgi:hypothetical protein
MELSYRFQTFQALYRMSSHHRVIPKHLPKSDSMCNMSKRGSVLQRMIVRSMPNPQAEGLTIISCIGLLIQYIPSYSSVLPVAAQKQQSGYVIVRHGVLTACIIVMIACMVCYHRCTYM